MMENGKLSFSLQKYYKTPSDRAEGKELYFVLFHPQRPKILW